MFIEPEKWAQRAVGTKFRYHVLMVSIICIGLGLMFMFYLLTSRTDTILRFSLLILIFAACIEIPLLLLYSLRGILMRSMESNGSDTVLKKQA